MSPTPSTQMAPKNNSGMVIKDRLPVQWNGQGWMHYKKVMLTAFQSDDTDDLEDIATGKLTLDPAWTELKKKKFRKAQAKIQSMIMQSLSQEVAQQVLTIETGPDMWDYLCKFYEGRQNARITLITERRLCQQLQQARYMPGSSLSSHIAYMFNIRQQLVALNKPVSDYLMIEWLLESLPTNPRFDRVRACVEMGEESVDSPEKVRALIQTLDWQNQMDGLHKEKEKNHNKNDQNKKNSDGKTPSRKTDFARGQCFKCHIQGHKATDCPGVTAKNANPPKSAGTPRALNSTSGPRANWVAKTSSPISQDETTTPNPDAYDPEAWCFDCGCNIHVVGTKEFFVEYHELKPVEQSEEIKGFVKDFKTEPLGIGSIELVTLVNGKHICVRIEDVLYVPASNMNLLSQSLCENQGFTVEYDSRSRTYSVKKDDVTVITSTVDDNGLYRFLTFNRYLPHPIKSADCFVNFAVVDGVADENTWHERMGHLCRNYLRIMVDKGLVEGMMLKKRDLADCSVCHITKQRKSSPIKKLDRHLKSRNEMIFCDLLIPPRNNGTRYEAVLVIVDGYSRFTTIYPLKSKQSSEVNSYMRRYVLWAEKQFDCPVKQILTDNGGEFVNKSIDEWYQTQGIAHLTIPPHSSRLNICERTHQTVVNTAKALMKSSGFPKSFWIDALQTAVYLRNRSYCRQTGVTPFERMYDRRPDIHHIRKFGSVAYAFTPLDSRRKKFHDNSRIGYVLGYRDNVAGCKLYFPTEHVTQFVADVRVNEDVCYGDRRQHDEADLSFPWDSLSDVNIEEGENVNEMVNMTGSATHIDADDSDASMVDATTPVPALDASMHTATLPSDAHDTDTSADHNDDRDVEDAPDDTESVNVNTGSEHELSDLDDDDSSNDTSTPDNAESSSDTNSDENDPDGATASASTDATTDPSPPTEDHVDEEADDSRLSSPEMMDIEVEEYETPVANSEASDDALSLETASNDTLQEEEQTSDNEETVKRQRVSRRPGLRNYVERRRPKYLDEYVVYSTVLYDQKEQPEPTLKQWKGSDIRIPRSYAEAMRSEQSQQWLQAMETEINAIMSKGVLKVIPTSNKPEDKRSLRLMWVYAIKTDDLDNVVRFRARLVGRGDSQVYGVDFVDSFAPVARLSSFRLLLALSAILKLKLFQCDVNTAYLNAPLKIKQYVSGIPGFPCQDGHLYEVCKALYGLHQSGREWNEAFNDWLLKQDFQRCATEPCLYFYERDGIIALVLIYVDDVLCATNSEAFKNDLFHKMNMEYGIKDQGLAHSYLGIQIEQTDTGIKIHQTSYCNEVLKRFGFDQRERVSKIPMEVNAKFSATLHLNDQENVTDDDNESTFNYRSAVGALMYLATSTRPDLAFAVGYLSRFVSKPTRKHIGAIKKVLKYLNGTHTNGILYQKPLTTHESKIKIDGYCDSDWGNDPDTRKSVTGFVFLVAGGAISWMAHLQSIVAQSTAEAEYVAACEACMESQALKNILIEIAHDRDIEVQIGIDNQAAFVMATNPTYSRQTRHIELRWHYVREEVVKRNVSLWKVESRNNPADMFTKPLCKDRLIEHCTSIGMMAGPTPSHDQVDVPKHEASFGGGML